MRAAKKRPSSSRSNLSTRWQRFRSRPYLFWPSLFLGGVALILLAFFIAIQLGADFGTFQDQLYQRGLTRPFQPQQEGEILIVITSFDAGDGTGQSTFQDALKAAIEQQLRDSALAPDIRIEIDPEIIGADALNQARQIGQFHKATTVIWGASANAQGEAHFLDVTRPDFESFTANKLPSEAERPILAAPDEYVQFVSDDLLSQIDFLALYAIGNAFLITENYVQAENVIGEALTILENQSGTELQPNLSNLRFRLAFSSEKSGDFEQAITTYTRIIEADPEHVDALTNRGNVYSSLGEYDQAIADYDQAIAINPQSLITLINRGNIYFNLGEYEKALADFDRAAGLDPTFSVIFALRGNVYFNLGQYDRAITEYDQAIALDPTDGWAFNNRGGVYAALGDDTKAIADLDQAIALDPQLGIAYYSRGNLYVRLGEPQKAISDFSQVINLDPRYAFGFYGRATVYDSLGEYEKAIADYDQAIVLDPGNKDFYLDRGGAYGNIGNHEQAIADFDQVISLDPQQMIAYFNRGNAYAFLGEHEVALADYTQALTLDPTFGAALYRRALALRELGRFDEALADLQSALALDPPPDARAIIEQTVAEIEAQTTD